MLSFWEKLSRIVCNILRICHTPETALTFRPRLVPRWPPHTVQFHVSIKIFIVYIHLNLWFLIGLLGAFHNSTSRIEVMLKSALGALRTIKSANRASRSGD